MEEASDSSELFPERERRDAAYGSASRCACSVASLPWILYGMCFKSKLSGDEVYNTIFLYH